MAYLNRDAGEGWWSAYTPLRPLLPSPATHSRVSAGMCSLSLRDFMARPGRVYTAGYRHPLCGPQTLLLA